MIDPFISTSEQETIRFGEELGKQLHAGEIVCLQGPLGAGKTHLVKGVAKAFGIDPAAVHSPTYTLINEYAGRLPLYHFDCYRMKSPAEALEIGAEEYFYGEGVCIIEWPERIEFILPQRIIWITLSAEKASRRKFSIKKKGY